MVTSLSCRHIIEAIDTTWLGHNCTYYPVVNSTNDTLREMADRGEPEGTLVIADYQQKGKGRLGRKWLAPYGTSLLFSTLFRPDWPAEQYNWLVMIAGIACLQAVQTLFQLPASLKWPNDIGLEKRQQWTKLGGILLEGNMTGERITYAVIGIGLNVNIPAEQLPKGMTPPTSLLVESGKATSRTKMLAATLKRMEMLYEQAISGQSPYETWKRSLVGLNERVKVSDPQNKRHIEGRIKGTDPTGRLIVRDNSGELFYFSAGDVTLVS